ncbi:MAG: aminotransferase class V-fold PLP-dependent enzyme, partial [Bacteroidota bacterium]
SYGQKAITAVDESREKIAKIIGADFREIIFTGSATEANNLAIRGLLKGIRNQELGIGENKIKKH